jgi:ATP/ADP translocase
MVGMTNFFLGNWATRIYLGAVAVLIATSAVPFAKICLIALSAPVAVIFAPIYLLGTGWLTTPMMVLSVTAGVLLNTLLINTIVGQVGAFRIARSSAARDGQERVRGQFASGPRAGSQPYGS